LPLTTKFWRQASSLGGLHRYPEWMKFAEVVLVMVPGSVEDERMFSAMKYLKNPQRNRLKEQHVLGVSSARRAFSHFPSQQPLEVAGCLPQAWALRS